MPEAVHKPGIFWFVVMVVDPTTEVCMVVVVGEDTVALKGKGACVIFDVRVCVVAGVLFVVGATFCGGVIVFGEGVSVFVGDVLIFGFGVVISSGGGLLLTGGVITSGGGIFIFDGTVSVSIFAFAAAVQPDTPAVLELFGLNDFSSPILVVFGVLFPVCAVVQHGVTFNKSLCDCKSC